MFSYPFRTHTPLPVLFVEFVPTSNNKSDFKHGRGNYSQHLPLNFNIKRRTTSLPLWECLLLTEIFTFNGEFSPFKMRTEVSKRTRPINGFISRVLLGIRFRLTKPNSTGLEVVIDLIMVTS